MIISRAPLRITLGGGGTDLPSYYKQYGGFLISGAINKYILVGANKQFYDNYSLKYSKIEIAKRKNDIGHKLIREALKLLDIKPGIEITSLADIPSGTGLGSSGAFLVSLLNTLHHYKGNNPTKRQLAEEACKIELEILKEHEGKQDKYACAFGGIKAYKFLDYGKVEVMPLIDEDIIISELESKLHLYFTGEKRKGTASDALKTQDEKTKKGDSEYLSYLHQIKVIGKESANALQKGDFDKFGILLNDHWEIKKQYSPECTNDFIEKCYKTAIDNGSLGGKIMGAGGGGGFFMFYHPGPSKETWDFQREMKKLGLHEMPFKFDREGVSIISKEEK